MNIEQIKTDLSAGVIVSPSTWRKLVEAALMMQEQLRAIGNYELDEYLGTTASESLSCLATVERL
jgi:hypothetical protein